MNREDIIRMAQQCGFGGQARVTNFKRLGLFATFVAAAEREACAQSCIETGATKGSSDDALDMADSCAAAIRARGEK